MPKPTKRKQQSSVLAQEVLDVLPAADTTPTDYSMAAALAAVKPTLSESDSFEERQRKVLGVIAAQFAARDKAADDAYAAQLVAEGKPIYTPEQVGEMFGIRHDKKWTQKWMQDLVGVGSVIFPLRDLAKRAEQITARYVTPGRKAMKALMADVYGMYRQAEDNDKQAPVFRDLRAYLKQTGVTVHKDAPNASVIVRMVFADFEPKQVHLYSRALEYAYQWGIEPENFVQFIEDEGGFEKVRASASKVKPENVLKLDDKQFAADLTKEWLEVEETDPFLTVTMLTGDQRKRLNGENWREVVLVARVEHDTLKVYARVPLTAELQKNIHAAVYKETGEDPEVLRKHIERRKQAAEARKAKDADPLYGYPTRRSEEGVKQAGASVVIASTH